MLTIAIQAGGQSRRMGTDKALVQLGGKPLIEHILGRVAGLADEILITCNHPKNLTYLGLPLVRDPIPGAGALAGLHTALHAARENRVLVLACDMPFVNRHFLEYMIELDPIADIVVPIHASYFEPMHAIYSKGCLPAIETALQNGHTRVVSFYKQVLVRAIDEKEMSMYKDWAKSFFNINTPEELVLAEKYLRQQSNAQ